MNSYVAWGIFGIISGLIASFADVPLVMLNQSENLKLGGVCPWWGDVTSKRFKECGACRHPQGHDITWMLYRSYEPCCVLSETAPLPETLQENV